MFMCLCDDTSAVLHAHPNMESMEIEGTALLIGKSVAMWKISSIRSKNEEMRQNDLLCAAIESRLACLLKMVKMFADIEKSGKG